MQVAICTDIHGNRHAFEAVIDAAESSGAEELWCLGDLVGYGAEPDACVALARERCTIVLAGNHDLAVVEVLSLNDFSRGAALAARWTQDVISTRRASSCSAWSRPAAAPGSASSTPPRAIRSGSTCCPG